MRKRYFIIVLALLFLMTPASCSKTEKRPKTQHYDYKTSGIGYEATEISSITWNGEGQLDLFAAKENRILYAIQEPINESYYITTKIAIYDVMLQMDIIDWVPANDRWYVSGVLTDQADALCLYHLTKDGIDVTGITDFGRDTKEITGIEGQIQEIASFGKNNVIVSYEKDNKDFGIGQICNYITSLLEIQVSNGTESLGGLLSTFPSEEMPQLERGQYYCMFCAMDGQGAIVCGDENGIQNRHILEYNTEKLDSFCATEKGVLACLSISEGTKNACRQMVLYDDIGKTVLKETEWTSGARYQMTGRNVVISVDNNWRIYCSFLRGYLSDEAFVEFSIDDVIPRDLNGQPVRILSSDEFSFFFFYPIQNRLFYVLAGPSA